MSQIQNKKEAQKELYEKYIFEKFAVTANASHQLEIELTSISNNSPPLPDIRCIISGKLHYFEMTEIVDNGLARNIAVSRKEVLRNKEVIITGGTFSQDNPLLKALTQKLTKKYPNLDGSLELLAYYDKQYPPTPELLKQETLPSLNLIAQNMTHAGSWCRLWIYDNWKNQILGVVHTRTVEDNTK